MSNITVSLAEIAISDNRRQRIYEALERAQMSYDKKKEIWKNILGDSDWSVISDIELDKNVSECLSELM